MEPIESEGRTVAEAVETALSKSGLRRDQVEITVMEEGAAGFMGLGAKSARVRLTEKRWGPDSPVSAPAPARARPASSPRPERRSAPRPAARQPERQPERRPERAPARAPEPRPSRPSHAERAAPRPITPAEAKEACAKAEQLVIELLGLMSIAAPTTTSVWDSDMERVKITVESQDASLLVGRDGRVLESLQLLTTLMLSRGNAAPIAVQVDALSYWEKQEQVVLDAARLAVENVKATGKPVRMEPMDSSMRRLVHRTLSSHPDVTTASEGEGPWRKLVVRSRKG
jgi:spoIIIJ-associated protein